MPYDIKGQLLGTDLDLIMADGRFAGLKNVRVSIKEADLVTTTADQVCAVK